MSSSQFRRGKRRFDDDESTFLKRDRHRRRLPPVGFGSETFGLPEGDRWSTWDQSTPTERGPQPHPNWLVTDLAAVDTRRGPLNVTTPAHCHPGQARNAYSQLGGSWTHDRGVFRHST